MLASMERLLSMTERRRRVSNSRRLSTFRPVAPASTLSTVSHPGCAATICVTVCAGTTSGPGVTAANGNVTLPVSGMTPPVRQTN